jgi:hypothetical protein
MLALNRLGLTWAKAARIFDYDIRTVARWTSGATPVPTPVAMLLRLALDGKIDLEAI